MAACALSIHSLTYTYPGRPAPALRDVSCTVRSGECVCLTGNSGCGKTTLLLSIKGLLHRGRQEGIVEIAAGSTEDVWSSPAGFVFQNAESQILCSTVAEEVAFGPENLCVLPDEIARRVRSSLLQVGLGDCATRNVERFSAGQKQRLAIASVLAMNPSLLLLDEPTSQLDNQWKLELGEILARLKRQGYTIIMAEHDPRPFASIIDRYLVMEGGEIVATASTAPRFDSPARAPSARARPTSAHGGTPEITVQGLNLTYPETGPALRNVNLQIRKGERVHLYGSNGAGKSSLLRCLVGLEEPESGTIEVAGISAPRPELLMGKVGLLFQNPARQLFAESVHDEVAFTLRRLGIGHGDRERIVEETLELCGIGHLGERAPLTLSFGEQHRVALASVVAPRPALLLLDEPFAGLDIPQRLALLAILAEMPERYGTTIFLASHDDLPDNNWADRSLTMNKGILSEAGQ